MLCTSIRDCEQGNDPEGLWGLLGGRLGNATSITVNGLAGVVWLKGELETVRQNGDTALGDMITALIGGGGAAAAVGLALLPTPLAPAGAVIASIGLSGVSTGLIQLLVVKASFDAMMKDVIGKVGDLEHELANGGVKNPNSYEVTVSEQNLIPTVFGPPGNWRDQQFDINVWQATG